MEGTGPSQRVDSFFAFGFTELSVDDLSFLEKNTALTISMKNLLPFQIQTSVVGGPI